MKIPLVITQKQDGIAAWYGHGCAEIIHLTHPPLSTTSDAIAECQCSLLAIHVCVGSKADESGGECIRGPVLLPALFGRYLQSSSSSTLLRTYMYANPLGQSFGPTCEVRDVSAYGQRVSKRGGASTTTTTTTVEQQTPRGGGTFFHVAEFLFSFSPCPTAKRRGDVCWY